jgi:hypothetical protein
MHFGKGEKQRELLGVAEASALLLKVAKRSSSYVRCIRVAT